MDEILGMGEDVVVVKDDKGAERKGKWKRDLIIELGRWVHENCEPNHGKGYKLEQIYDLFYNGDEKHKEELFSDPERIKSFVNTFIKTVNTLMKNEGLSVRIRKRGDKISFIKAANENVEENVEEHAEK